MRIWDIDPGYLNRQSLLGEHRELHGIVSIISGNKQGYSRHPETRRWVGYGWALKQRHRLLASEMSLRGYHDQSPVRLRANKGVWPDTYIDDPDTQILLLAKKYEKLEQGRIVLPGNPQQLWAQHKYSVMARDIPLYQSLGKSVANTKADRPRLINELVEVLRILPTEGGIRNTLQHMWGYVSDLYAGHRHDLERWTSTRLLRETRKLAVSSSNRYLLSSTALGELGAWIN